GVLGLVVLDETVVGVALPTIATDLNMTQVTAHWVVNAYLLTFTCAVAVAGKLGDVVSRHALFQIGMAIFGLSSLTAGFAQSGAWLVGATAVQGIGAAIIFPTSFAVVTAAFPPERRGSAFGVQTTIAGIFMAAGPLVGGFFAEAISWRWIFWLNIPIVVLIAAVASANWSPAFDGEKAETSDGDGFDTVGLVTLVVGLVAFVTALMEGSRWGWQSPATLSVLIGGLLVLTYFVVVERKKSDPLVDLALMRIRTFTGGILIFFVFQFNKIVVFVFVPLYLQTVRGWSAIDSGLVLMVAILPTLLTSIVAGRLSERYGARGPTSVGLALNGGAVMLLTLGTWLGQDWMIVVALVLWGATLPSISVVPRHALMNAVPAAQHSQASGVNLTVQMLGGTIGMALCTTLYLISHDFWLVFLVTGLFVLATIAVSQGMINREGPTTDPA
ncbi:MAG: MFS transporter, partial [Pseudomonadota bacterium]